MKLNKYGFLISTGLLSLLMVASASKYFLDYGMISETFTGLGFPTWLIYPLAVLKICGVIMLWLRKPNFLREWAYAGFMLNALIALGAHLNIGDGQWAGAAVAIVLTLASHHFGHHHFNEP